MIIFLASNQFNTITYAKQCCVPSLVAKKQTLNHFMRETTKNAKKTIKRNLARNFKDIKIVFDSKNFKIITYTKQCCVPCYVPNKPSLYHFMRESAKNAKKPQKRNFACNFKHMSIVFDPNHFYTIPYNKLYCVPNSLPNKPSLNHFLRESGKNTKKTSKAQLCTQFQAYDYCFRF